MKKQTVSLLVLLLAASGFFFSCGNTMNKNAGALEFDSIQVNETAHLFGDTASRHATSSSTLHTLPNLRTRR